MKLLVLLTLVLFSFNTWSSEWNADVTSEAEEYEFGDLKLISCTYSSQKFELMEDTDEETIIAFGKLMGNMVWQEIDYDIEESEGKKYVTTGEQFFTFIEVTSCPILQVRIFYN